MTTNRLSRGAPTRATRSEQEALVAAADHDPAFRVVLEAHLGLAWDALTFGRKLLALEEHYERGKALAAMNTSTRAVLEARALADQMRSATGEVINPPRASEDDAA